MASAGVRRAQQFPADDGFVPFYAAGAHRVGEFHCVQCGYGIVSRRTLPACPMCQAATWESPSRPFSRVTER